MKIECPECGQDVYRNAKKCRCGWSQVNAQQPKLAGPWRPDNCEHQSNGFRCQNPGTMTSIVRGLGKYYCVQHWRAEDQVLPPEVKSLASVYAQRVQ